MATKKKPATKRPAATAAKKPAAAAASAQQQAWTKQTAKLYQFPFSNSDMGEAAQRATETVRSTAEQFFKAGSDMLQQFTGQQAALPNFQFPSFPAFDAKAGEKAFGFGAGASEQFTKSAGSAGRIASEAASLSRENAEALVECGNIAATVTKQLSSEVMGYLNKSFAQNVELSKQAFGCRTLNDMFDLQTKIVKSNLDAFFSESLKISEIAFQCASDISEPLNERLSESTERLSKVAAA